MKPLPAYEKYPVRTVLFANIVSAGTYLMGFIILFSLGWILAAVFVAAVLLFEYRLLRYHCTSCYYWGKRCGFGRGWISSCFFRKGEPSKFNTRNITWKDLLPDMLITLFPLVLGLMLLVLDFSFILLGSVVVLILLATAGNRYIRGSLACKLCRQKELGCPAWSLFNREK